MTDNPASLEPERLLDEPVRGHSGTHLLLPPDAGAQEQLAAASRTQEFPTGRAGGEGVGVGAVDNRQRAPGAQMAFQVPPLWDAVATLLEHRTTGAGSMGRAGAANTALGLAATAGTATAVFSTIGAALLVFGLWALLSGALQLTVAIRRRHTVAAQWPMIISGGQSVLAGAFLTAMSASATGGLSAVAGYAAFGAFWFLVSVIALSIHRQHGTR